MITLLRREFVVEMPLAKAWDHLARVEHWPSWAKHITKVEMTPRGELGPQSKGLIYLSNGLKSSFSMSEFNSRQNWKWVGNFIWLTVHYDHRFQSLNSQQTRLIWIVEAEGLGVSVFGRLFAGIYSKNLDKAIPLLIEEVNAANGRAA